MPTIWLGHSVEYGYEQPLTIDGVTKYPDLAIVDAVSGNNYYWEHCGMLHVPSYAERWKEKRAWYKANGILPYAEGGGSRGLLIETRDSPQGDISSQEMEKVIREEILG